MNFSAIPRETALGRFLRLPLRLIPRDAQVRILQGPLRGKKWIAGSSNHGCWLGSYEYVKQKAFSASIQPGNVVFDIGANVGFYSLLASVLVGQQGRVFSFEPFPKNLALLRKHLALNHVTNCSVYDAAVSDSSGTAHFSPGEDSASGRLVEDAGNSISVRTIALDQLVGSGELPRPDLIKCDVEGGEFRALQGAALTLAAATPTIFLATHGPEVHRPCCSFLSQLGYALTPLDHQHIEGACELLAVHTKRGAAS
jgi:FkbM family methyltransferase